MKVILCTGDSHTCGQYSEGQSSWDYESLGYNILGKGFTRSAAFDGKCYVNQIRNFITEYTDSAVENMDISGWGTEIARMCKVKNPLTIAGGCDMLLLKIGEKQRENAVSVYLDGEFYRRKVLCAPVTRYGIWSFTYMAIPCTGKQKIELVPENGPVHIDSCERWSGEYMVVNCGVGSCTMERYLQECIPDLIDEFQPYAFLAEVHTVNDWVKGNTVEAYGSALADALKVMTENAELTVAITVPAVLREEPLPYTKDFYRNFVAESYRVIKQAGVPMADVHRAFRERAGDRSAEELLCSLYGDDLHPAQEGNDLYAEVIIESLKRYLSGKRGCKQ